MYNIIYNFILISLLVFLSDKTLLLFFGDISRWFQLHFIGNMFICYFSGQNLLQLRNMTPESLIEYNENTMICCIMTFVLHFYHTLFFKMSNTDFYHHLYFVFLTGIMLGIIYPNIYLPISISTFFITGLPGGIVYFLLCLQKRNWITKSTQKEIHSYVDTYIRIPGGILAAILNYYASILSSGFYTQWVYFMMGLLAYINVTYYGKMAIENNIENKHR